jgi:ferredoxin
VECIYAYTGEDREKFPNQLYIHPEECIDCGACEPECPWEAIYEDASVPDVFKADIAHNAAMMDEAGNFEVPVREDKESPSPEEVAENKVKWGLG